MMVYVFSGVRRYFDEHRAKPHRSRSRRRRRRRRRNNITMTVEGI